MDDDKSHRTGVMEVENVNAHLHTPYSFSAFESIPQAMKMAAEQNVKVVGINDFYSMEGYAEWDCESRARGLYPLFNIEFISLNAADRQRGVRVNDPNNPGRTYLSGKGLAYPVTLCGEPAEKLAKVREESNKQVKAMCDKVSGLFKASGRDFGYNYELIKSALTLGSVRERHLAKAIRHAVERLFPEAQEAAAFYSRLFGGKALKSDHCDKAGIENEIRSNLLKAGGAAFVPETPEAFLPMEEVRRIILEAGGIPTYPFLADDSKGGFTDFEEDLQDAAAMLKKRGFYSVEFISTRNCPQALEKYAQYLWDQGFVVTFGSEHNTPAMEPVMLTCRGGVPLSDSLKLLNYQGACVIAAHQKLRAERGYGYLDSEGRPRIAAREEFIDLGDSLIKAVVHGK